MGQCETSYNSQNLIAILNGKRAMIARARKGQAFIVGLIVLAGIVVGFAEPELAFVPDGASAGRLRGYFVEISFSATHTNWVMKNSYPPRLKVLPQPK